MIEALCILFALPVLLLALVAVIGQPELDCDCDERHVHDPRKALLP